MASKSQGALTKLKEQLTCSICLSIYTDPKQLQCHHSYCEQCLVGLMQRHQQGLVCPTCRQVTTVPPSGVAGLQADFRANQLLEIINDELKNDTSELDSQKQEDTSATCSLQENVSVFCCDHDGKVLELYCDTCEMKICLKCVVTGGNHHGHDYEEIVDACKMKVQASLGTAGKTLATIADVLTRLDKRRDEISHQRVTIEAEIHSSITQDVKKTELISQLHQLTQSKMKSLAGQRDQLETTQTQLQMQCNRLWANSNSKLGEEILVTTAKQVNELTSSILPEMLEPNTEADMMLYTSLHHKSSLIIAGSLPCICSIIATATVGEKSTAVLETLDNSYQHSNISTESITCELVSDMNGTRVSGTIESRGQREHEITYQPTTKGRYQLHIKVKSQHIRGSPFSITAFSPVERIGAPILAISGCQRPVGVAVSKSGDVIVSEGGTCCITVFSYNGKKRHSFGSRGARQQQFQSPCRVAVDDKENIFVIDTYNHRMLKFTAEGKFLASVGTKGSGTQQFNHPRDIAFNSSNRKVYIVDSGNCRIQIFNADFSYFNTLWERGNTKKCLANPRYIACDKTGNVYISDSDKHCIQVFTVKGKWLRMFGQHGNGRGDLKDPYSISVDSNDRVYVSEWGNDRVSVFTSKGQFVTSFGGKGEGQGRFCGPAGVAVDNSGVVYVCDYLNNRVQLF